MATAATNATGVDESRNDGVRALAMYEVEQTEADEVGGRAGWSEEADGGARWTEEGEGAILSPLESSRHNRSVASSF